MKILVIKNCLKPVSFLIMLLMSDLCFAEKPVVKTIEFSGNYKFSDRTLKKIMLTKETGIFSKPTFHKNLFYDDIESIAQFYRNCGYLDVDIRSQVSVLDSLKDEVFLKLKITEGNQTVIDTIVISGNEKFSENEIRYKLSLKQKTPFNESLLETDNYVLLALYAQKGYIDATVKQELNRDHENSKISINFFIDEGIEVRIKNVNIDGLVKTKPHVIQRELLLEPGMIFDYSKILQSQHRLYQTGLFRNVSIKPVIVDSSRREERDLQVHITEKDNGEINFGIGFGSYDRLRFSSEVFQNNFLGDGNQIGCRLRVSYIIQRFEFLFTNPYIFGTRIKFDLNNFIEHRVEPNYTSQSWGGTATIGKSFTQFSKATLTYKYEDVTFSEIKDTSEVEELNKGNIRSLLLSGIRDSRDSQFNTTAGSYLDFKFESAGGFLKGTHTFVKVTTEARNFRRIKQSSFILGSRLFLGWMDNFGESLIIPLSERFYAGGPGSVRGYGRSEIGPEDSQGNPVGGRVILLTNLEVRFPIYKKFGASLFWDMGNVWQHVSNVHPFRLRHGAGIGLRYNSPLGIIRVDAGLKVNRRQEKRIGEIYFTLGQIF